MIFSISWRNIWRNKVRSFVIITAVALGIFASVYATAFIQGMVDQRIQKVIRTELSFIQVHHPGFRQTTEYTNYMANASELKSGISRIPHVSGVSNRLVLQSMITSTETASGITIVGFDPEEEKKITNISNKIIEGNYFRKDDKNPVIIGRKLAEKLNVKIKSKVVITLQDLENNITSGAFRVVGIFSTDNNMFDESQVYIRYDDMARLTDFPVNAAHEIAVSIDENENMEAVQAAIKTIADGEEVKNWKELSPEMSYLTETMDLYLYIFVVIILLALLFGIINTMLMVVMERTKELGMLMAIGMNKHRIFFMIVLESVMLSLVGGIIGIFIGGLATFYGQTHPIDLSLWAEGYREYGYDSFVYTTLMPGMMFDVAIMVMITGVIAAIYPAYKALKNNPADALRME